MLRPWGLKRGQSCKSPSATQDTSPRNLPISYEPVHSPQRQLPISVQTGSNGRGGTDADTILRGHLAGGLARVDDDALSNTDKRRFLIAVGDDYWTARTHGEVLSRIRADLVQDSEEGIADTDHTTV